MYFQDDWALRSNLSLHLGMRYEVDQRSFINTTHKDFGPRRIICLGPFLATTKPVVRGRLRHLLRAYHSRYRYIHRSVRPHPLTR